MTGSLTADGRRRAIHPADVSGRFTRARHRVFLALIAVYLVLPFIAVGGERLVLIDVARRRFFLFGLRFNAQDLWLTALVLLLIGASLIYATTLLGRAWCGWACPQTVFLEGVFRRVERWLLGPAGHRLKHGRWTADKIARTAAAHLAYAAIALCLALVFFRYFTEGLTVIAVPFGAILYFNFAWFREQTCVVVCPYGRLQSVLLDDDSLVIGYDARRGEPRGKAHTAGAGDCVDCGRCVAVCPTGIDIRDGLQLDCIACTACIDACDDIMDKLHRRRGLIRYDSQRGLRGNKRRVLRPRVVVSTAVLVLLLAAGALAARRRTDFEANLLRLPGAPYVLDGDVVRNTFEVHLVNKRSEPATFALRAEPAPSAEIIVVQPTITLAPFEDSHALVVVTVPRDRWRGAFTVELVVSAGSEPRRLSAPVLGPQRQR